MAKNFEVTKRPDEIFPVGLRYSTPDLDEDETISSLMLEITSDDEETPILVVDGSPTIEFGTTVKQTIKLGTADVEYKVIFTATTSAGYVYEDFIYVKVRSL